MPSDVTNLLDPRNLEKFGNLELVARKVVEGFISGKHKSPFKGFSVEFAEHREYSPGDEIRTIDWRAYAKTDRYYVKEFEEETNLRANILVDASGSMRYGAQGSVSKFQYACSLAAALAYLLLHQQDAVGLATFDTAVRRYIPPRAVPNHLRIICQELRDTQPAGDTQLASVFHDLAERVKRGGLVIIISDMFYDIKPLLTALQHFRHRRHEVMVFQPLDRDELTFPFKNWTEFRNLENADHRRRIDPARIRSGYLAALRQFLAELKTGCGQLRIDHVMLDTETPYDYALARYLARRAWRS